ncbi:RNA 2',3'-cyclic phosphodiesterase [Methylomonas methanica]|uniref:RNA 2',3'-cyclic phosphodiesterase n=1 Tax=Methylomonas methanica (strain DSM 25384 / MC09) TaxID=857087 RepID=F9ZV41_METMM|nr:RNA 2',3'-cyclic phosphodiesterase [Methylomonas methanica]AEF99474.1 2'-5' RNA ligase [Methylomonas methanica MC09]
MKRLFFALWPNQDTRRQCNQLSLKMLGCGKPVAANNLHVTLLFLGLVDAAGQQAVSKAACRIAIEPFCLAFDRVDFWKKPAIVCLRAEQVDRVLSTWVETLTVAALENGIAVDQRPYKPHVTLLRKAKQLPVAEFEPIIWRAEGFCLVESCSTPSGVEYRVLERWGLSA